MIHMEGVVLVIALVINLRKMQSPETRRSASPSRCLLSRLQKLLFRSSRDGGVCLKVQMRSGGVIIISGASADLYGKPYMPAGRPIWNASHAGDPHLNTASRLLIVQKVLTSKLGVR